MHFPVLSLRKEDILRVRLTNENDALSVLRTLMLTVQAARCPPTLSSSTSRRTLFSLTSGVSLGLIMLKL